MMKNDCSEEENKKAYNSSWKVGNGGALLPWSYLGVWNFVSMRCNMLQKIFNIVRETVTIATKKSIAMSWKSFGQLYGHIMSCLPSTGKLQAFLPSLSCFSLAPLDLWALLSANLPRLDPVSTRAHELHDANTPRIEIANKTSNMTFKLILINSSCTFHVSLWYCAAKSLCKLCLTSLLCLQERRSKLGESITLKELGQANSVNPKQE